MRQGRKPAQCAKSFRGRDIMSSTKFPEDAQIIHQECVSQPPLRANYCDHSPNFPKLFSIPSNHKPRAKVVQETDRRLRNAYDKPKLSLKSLQFRDESGYQVRSERREAAIGLLQAMNYYQDDATGRVGRLQDNGGFRDLSLKRLAEYAGLRLRRAKRAMADIIRCGYMKVARQFRRNRETGEVKGLPSMRSFLPKFFIDLDIDGAIWSKWFSQRGWARKRMENKVIKQDKKKSMAVISLLKETVNAVGVKVKKGLDILQNVPSVESNKQAEQRIQNDKKLMNKALEMFNLDSSKTISEYYKSLKESSPPK